jgi:hypothetical protein
VVVLFLEQNQVIPQKFQVRIDISIKCKFHIATVEIFLKENFIYLQRPSCWLSGDFAAVTGAAKGC